MATVNFVGRRQPDYNPRYNFVIRDGLILPELIRVIREPSPATATGTQVASKGDVEALRKEVEGLRDTITGGTAISTASSIEELVKLDETGRIERKSSFQWDFRLNTQNTDLRRECFKTMDAFLNAEGGTLLIGVRDDGSICGVEKDLSLCRGSHDKFERLLHSTIGDAFGAKIYPLYRVELSEISEHLICVINVQRSPGPIYMQWKNEQLFFVRRGNNSAELKRPQDVVEYCSVHWARPAQ